MKRWRCSVCGYTYDPDKGDVFGGIPPHTPFEAVPPTWHCPRCDAPRDKFFPVEWVE